MMFNQVIQARPRGQAHTVAPAVRRHGVDKHPHRLVPFDEMSGQGSRQAHPGFKLVIVIETPCVQKNDHFQGRGWARRP